MNKLVFIGVVSLFVGCREIKQDEEMMWKISERKVTISLGKKFDNPNMDVFVINIPIEFDLNVNYSEIKHIKFYYKTLNEIYSNEGYHYIIYNGDTNTPIFEKGQWGYPNYPSSIYIIDRRLTLDDSQVKNLLNTYNINYSVDDIRNNRDTVVLTSYSKFRKDYPNFIQEMKVIPDSLIMRVSFSKGKVKLVEKKIEW